MILYVEHTGLTMKLRPCSELELFEDRNYDENLPESACFQIRTLLGTYPKYRVLQSIHQYRPLTEYGPL